MGIETYGLLIDDYPGRDREMLHLRIAQLTSF